MTESMKNEAIQMFHQMWDAFPGIARLINNKHMILASNPLALKKGFVPGAICAKAGSAESHKECKLQETFRTKIGHTDKVLKDRIRGWMPLEKYPDCLVHFTVIIPE